MAGPRVWLLAAAAALAASATAKYTKPAMGWSTWNSLACGITEVNIADNVQTMVQLGLVAAGYKGLHIDDCWASGRYPNGTIIPDPKVFPSGFQKTVDTIKGAGMLLGMYTARGTLTCGGRPGMMGHEAQDAASFAGWGVDYLKVDSCDNYGNATAWDEYSLISQAVYAATPNPPYIELCERFPFNKSYALNHSTYGDLAYTTAPWLSEGLPVDTIANTLLIEYVNMADTWEILLSNYDAQFQLASRGMTFPGLTNHMDMMTLCMGAMSIDEYKTQLSIWSIMGSPLILGNDFDKTDKSCIAEVMLNTDVIAVNQDDLVAPASLVLSAWTPQGVSAVRYGQEALSAPAAISMVWWQVLQRPLASGQQSVLILCRDAPDTAAALLTASVCAEGAREGMSAASRQLCEDAASAVARPGAASAPLAHPLTVTLGTQASSRRTLTFTSLSDPVTYLFNMSLPTLGYPSASTAEVTDLWAHTANGTVTGAVPVVLAPHQSAHLNLKITPPAGFTGRRA